VRFSLRRIPSVDAVRKKIDQADEKIIELLNERARLAQEIGRIKTLRNEAVYVPSREKTILQRIESLNPGPLSQLSLRSIYREIISASRSLEAPIRVAYLGPEATFTQMAAHERFGLSSLFVPVSSISEVFQEVAQGRTDYGVVPIENSSEGVIAHTLDLLVESNVTISGEIFLEIHQNLLSRSGQGEQIQRIVSHPQALAQCRGWLTSHFPKITTEEAPSTAQAAQMASQDTSLAAVASSLAKEIYDLRTVEANIEDQANNITRFFVIGNHVAPPTGQDKTSIVFSVKDEVGVLHRMLDPFSKNKVNLTKIESRPLKLKPWEYLFFLDFNGHREEPKVLKALKQLEKQCIFEKVLGSYPCGL
jgi:chorismate mutase/prephenate dehydratase